jgi:dephospho-CoA kinase
MRRVLLGVTGGIASGKSVVADMLRDKGARTIDFDLLTREIEQPGQPAYCEIASLFGAEVLQDNGMLDRKRLSEIVFADPEKKALLERVTHPRIREEFFAKFNGYISEDPYAIVQAVIPLLIESGIQRLFDRILVVYAPETVQLSRLVQRDRISEQQAKRIVDAQLDIEQKRRHADFLIDNSGGLDETRRQVEALWRRLQTLREGRASDEG